MAERFVDSYGCVECARLRKNGNRAANREEVRRKNNEYLARNRDKQRAWWAAHYAKHRQHHIERATRYATEHRAERSARKTQRLRENIEARLAALLRERVRGALRRDAKRGSAVRDLGCSIAELKVYIESQFSEGMSWENWGSGRGCWHLDHIRPLSGFDLTDREQFLAACHFSNLQPLWMEANLAKGGVRNRARGAA